MFSTVLIPEPFSGDCGNWQDWIDHFESVAVVNKWETDGEKLKWLRVRLTGKTHTVFMKLPENIRKDYGECVKALKRRFFPNSKKELYVAELHTRAKRDDEDWASFGDALRVYPIRLTQTWKRERANVWPSTSSCHRLKTPRLLLELSRSDPKTSRKLSLPPSNWNLI